MDNIIDKLKGGDLRSIGEANEIVKVINTQTDFDRLFLGLFHSDRKVAMRTIDAIEKITLVKSKFLATHKKEILELCNNVKNIELKWHLALLVTRLSLTAEELGSIWQLLTIWATDKKESKIVRVNSVQSLFILLHANKELEKDFNLTLDEILKENVPSLVARIRKIKMLAANSGY
jgi:hypothetical protein